ncbi:glycoside hydrolase [Lojkania enalia]|uniref:chitinase n=1 Tax=Lojkania enalia TaxID=147567 RepID=A0A9P4N4S6_9PLEO|nr:glycoside hydrolase [Didymosphaeria enalia]
MRLPLLCFLLLVGEVTTRQAPSKDWALALQYDILGVGEAYAFAGDNGTHSNTISRFFTKDGKGCGPNRPCIDKSCCNSNGYCGFKKEYCSPDAPVTCISGCGAKAQCGKDSKYSKKKCPLSLCCSDYGYCGTDSEFCDQNNKDHPCQKDFGGCEVHNAPQCDKISGSATNGRKIGYYAAWNTRTRPCNRIWPKHLKAKGFSHMNFAFASIDPKTFQVVPADPNDVNLYRQFTALKTPRMQTWISVGGWEFSDEGQPTRKAWSDLARSRKNRRTFCLSAILFMRTYGFQGIDLDWEYPGATDRGGRDEDTENFVTLVKDMKALIGDTFGLSVAIPATFSYMQFFDPKAMEPYVDWFNLMSYDLHGLWDSSYLGIGPKILPHTSLMELEKFLVPLWFSQTDPKKVNLGFAYYGRGYTVKDINCANLGCEFKAGSKPGNCTDVGSILSRHEIKRIAAQKHLKPELIKDAAVKVIKWDDQWVSYDDKETLQMKLEYANSRCFGGSFVWTVDFYSGKGRYAPIQDMLFRVLELTNKQWQYTGSRQRFIRRRRALQW